MDDARESVAPFVAKFLQRVALERGCDVDDLSPMVSDAFDLALACLQLGDDRAHERQTLVDAVPAPRVSWESEDDRITQPYPFELPPIKE